jgi:hypothetical protein
VDLLLAARPDALTGDPKALLSTRELDSMVARACSSSTAVASDLRALHTELQRAWDMETVALFIAPPG